MARTCPPAQDPTPNTSGEQVKKGRLYSTARGMPYAFESARNDLHKKAKAHALYRNLHIGEQAQFDASMFYGLRCTRWNHRWHDKAQRPVWQSHQAAAG